MTVSRLRVPLTGALLFGVAACAPLGTVLDDTGMGGGRSTYLSGEIRSIDTRRARIQVREQYGRDHTVRYDNRTRVTHEQRQYPVSALERGDFVRMQVGYDRDGTPWAERVEVRQSARAVSSRVERLDGTVGSIDYRRGYFTVQRNRLAAIVVHVPNRATRDDVRRFERLRRGDRVRVDVRATQRNQAELVRFR